MDQLAIVCLLVVAGNQHPYWTRELYEEHSSYLHRIKKNRRRNGCYTARHWFRHSDEDMTRWLTKLKRYLEYSGINIQVYQWCFASLLEDPGFCLHLLNCLAAFYKHQMHISIIECINIMVDAFLVYESGCDEYDRDSDGNSEWQYRTLCCANLIIPFAALCMFMHDPVQYHFMSDDLGKILIRRIRSFYRKTDRPDVFSSLSFDSLGIPTYHESSGISLVNLLRPSGRIAYPIESVFSINPQYKKFGEVFKSLISSEPFMRPERFFQRAFSFLPEKNSRHVLHTLQTILRTQCKDVSFSQSELSSILIECLNAHPNLKSVIGFTGFLFQTFLRTREQSLQLRIAWRSPIEMHLQVGCNQIPFDAQFVRRIKMIGFLDVLLSHSERISRNQSYSIIRRVLSNLLL
jgi:hypothetical protein